MGLIVKMCSSALNFSFNEGRSEGASGLRFNRDRAIGAGLGCSTEVLLAMAADRGLEPVLGFELGWWGLKGRALTFGLNSLLWGLSRPPCALVTPLDRREKLGSMGLDGPVGGWRASWRGIACIAWLRFCFSRFFNRAPRLPGPPLRWAGI